MAVSGMIIPEESVHGLESDTGEVSREIPDISLALFFLLSWGSKLVPSGCIYVVCTRDGHWKVTAACDQTRNLLLTI